ncbi:MAG: response regulator [Oscillospiraceae bacterium]|nr:response regulator [Oscillospiraceae bacterium]
MYHCRILIHLAGVLKHISEVIRATPFPKEFTVEFSEGELADAGAAAGADIIIAQADNGGGIADTIKAFCAAKKSDGELIVMAPSGTDLFSDEFSGISNVWNLPVTDQELRFRLGKLIGYLKMRCASRQAEGYLEAVINTSPSLIWFKNRDGIHEKVNESFCRAVNKSREQVEGSTHGYIWGVDGDDPACVASDNHVMESREMLVNEETITTSQGERLMTTYKSPLYDLDGSVMGTVGLGIDITRERQFEEEIIKKNRVLEKIFTSIDCGVMTHSLSGDRVFSANNAALRILGYESVEEMLASGFDFVAESVLDEDKPILRERIKTLKEEGDAVSLEYRVRTPSGKIRHITGTVKLLDDGGEPYYQRFLLDCTKQKLREHENEQLIQALSEDYNLVCYFDRENGKGHALRLNDCEKHMLGTIFSGKLELESCIGAYAAECVYEEDRDTFIETFTCENLKKILSETNTYYLNYRVMCDSTLRYFQVKAVRVGSKGAVLGFRCVDEEIRKDMEKRDLLENALAQANRASSAKSAFLSNMSHDIRTPMNAIIGFTTLALSRLDNIESVEECLKKISISGDHLLRLINDVLDMSRIESGKVFLEENPASLSDITAGLKNILQSEIAAKDLEFHINTVNVYDENIICDRLRLNQILLNLLSNAIKYTPEGGSITFRISENAGARDGYANYEFLIKDNGIGMDKEFLAKIFEPFERERNSTLSGIQGTGLGMAITKNLVDLMNGSIEVDSEKGVGTEVTLTFSFKLYGSGEDLVDYSLFKGHRALIIDESSEVCESVSSMLRMLGIRADSADSAESAVELIKKYNNYSAVIIDHDLSATDSINAVKEIRAALPGSVPIIMQSAHDKSKFEDEARAAGVSAFCSKPLFLSELRGCLAELLSADSRKIDSHIRSGEKIRSGRILLTEDNELNREIAETILTEAGFEVETAENGKEAVDMLTAKGAGYYKLVLMDVQMPVMNGYEATRAIRALDDSGLSSIPIIAMTANAFDEDRQAAINSGMNAHIAKPINIKTVFETLDAII